MNLVVDANVAILALAKRAGRSLTLIGVITLCIGLSNHSRPLERVHKWSDLSDGCGCHWKSLIVVISLFRYYVSDGGYSWSILT